MYYPFTYLLPYYRFRLSRSLAVFLFVLDF